MIGRKEADDSCRQHFPLPPGGIVFGQDFDHFIRLKTQLIVVLCFERINRNDAFCRKDHMLDDEFHKVSIPEESDDEAVDFPASGVDRVEEASGPAVGALSALT